MQVCKSASRLIARAANRYVGKAYSDTSGVLSAAAKSRPALAAPMRRIVRNDVLVVVRLDRLARSVNHLLEIVESLQQRCAHFRSLRDPIDKSTPQGMLSLPVLEAVAQL